MQTKYDLAYATILLTIGITSCMERSVPPQSPNPQPAVQQGTQQLPNHSPPPSTNPPTQPNNTTNPNDITNNQTTNPGNTPPGNNEQNQTPPNTSQGTGGQSGLATVNFAVSNGLNSSYKINAPADAASGSPYGLHIHLHGDGGGGYRDFPNRETRSGLIGVTVKAPNRNLQWGRSEGRAHARYLQDLIQNDLLKKYNVRLDRIYFSGVSGGAYFLTGSFLPEFGQHYNSGAYIMCGGEAPRVPFAQPDMLKTFRIYWQVTAGERGDITRSVQQSIAAYDRALTQLVTDNSFDKRSVQDQETKGNGGHCEFDDRSYTTGIQFMIDTKFESALKISNQ